MRTRGEPARAVSNKHPTQVLELPIRGGGLGNVRTPVVKSAIAERAPLSNVGARVKGGSREGVS